MAEKGKEKVTMMKLTVDLDCEKCYKKVKKVLCKFPQIRDQVFDEKSNIVIIKVVCCSPERIMDKLCSKGGGSIKTIEIITPKPPGPGPGPAPQAQPPPQKPKEAEKPKPQEKPKEAEKPKPAEKPKEAEKPKPAEKPKETEKPKPAEKPKETPGPAPGPKPAPATTPAPAPKQPGPPPQAIPVMPQGPAMCCGPYYDGYAGPSFNGYGMPPQQPYECYGRPVYDSWGGGYPPPPVYRQCHVTRCDYFSEENPQSCSIM